MEPPVLPVKTSAADASLSESSRSSVNSPLEMPPPQLEGMPVHILHVLFVIRLHCAFTYYLDPGLPLVVMERGWKYIGDNLDLTVRVPRHAARQS